MFDSSSPTRSDPLFPTIVLSKATGHWLASPADRQCSASQIFLPFPLPLPPRSLIDWLVVAGHRVWRQHRRCIAALLLVDRCSGQWTLRLPRQRCGADRADWSVSRSDFAKLPASMHIGGTFQSISCKMTPQDVAPAHDGFHFTLAVTAQKPLMAFVRCGNSIQTVEPLAILASDWAKAIDDAMPRLRIA